MARRAAPALALFCVLTVLRSSIALAAWPHDSNLNLAICTAGGSQYAPATAPDGLGGAFVAWYDNRSAPTGFDIYIQHITRAGIVDPTWTVNGKLVCNAAGDQTNVKMISDNAGGVFLVWQDHRNGNWDIYGTRLGPSGTQVAGWVANGNAIYVSGGDQLSPQICTDGGNGVYVEFEFTFGVGDNDPYLIRLNGDGSVPIGWGGGADVDGAFTLQQGGVITPDGSGNAIVAYETNEAGNFDIKLAKYGPGGSRLWGATATSAAGEQRYPVICSDGLGGAYVAWSDASSGDANTQLNHISASGGTAPWPSNGDTYASTTNPEVPFALVPDGAEGCYLGWTEGGVIVNATRITRVLPGTDFAPGWYPYLTPSSGTVYTPVMISDGAGGVVTVNISINSAFNSILLEAQRFGPSASRALGWPGGADVMICGQTGSRDLSSMVADGNNGFIMAWDDIRDGANYHIYAQRVERFGQLGNPEPALAGIKDVKNDQGGQVRIQWNPSYLDVDPTFGILDYRVWRQVPAASAQQSITSGRGVLDDDARLAAARSSASAGLSAPASATELATRAAVVEGSERTFLGGRSVFRADPAAAQGYYWELIAYVQAGVQPAYSYVAPTTGDSLGASNPYTAFQVDARAYYGGPFWASAPDSGYSVDNLPPVAPAPFSATFSPPNGTFLGWGANGESDLAGYRLYRGGGLAFVPSPANRIYQGVVPSYHDVTSTAYIYKVCAYDIHGNEGGCTTAQPPGTSAVETETPSVLSLAPVDPNPARDGANLRFGLPKDGRVVISIFDAVGRRVRTVIDAWLPAGIGLSRWDGRDASGDPVGSGIYFVRLESAGVRLTRRFVTLR